MAGAGRIAILSKGLWTHRREIEMLSGLMPVLGGPAEAVAGWGHKPSADWARRAARGLKLPYIAFEDGFLRSVRPGNGMRPASMVMDRSGIYYDARQPSDLETMLNAGAFTSAERAEAREAMALLRAHRISKYNNAAMEPPAGLRPGYILLIDQTAGDASIPGALAGAESFRAMLDAAITASDGHEIVAKVHPDAISGAKPGHLAAICAGRKVTLIADAINPWTLLEGAGAVHTVSSQLGFEALLAGKPVTCHGVPFYAGWGLTHDLAGCGRRGVARQLEEVFAAACIRYARYFDLWTRRPVSAATSIDQLRFLRDRFLGNSKSVVAFGVTPWKRQPLQALLDGPAGPVAFARSEDAAFTAARETGASLLAWGKSANAAAARAAGEGLTLISAEDGFLRSAGLGAAFTESLSFSLDHQGIYYDASRPSELEALLQNRDVSAAERAAAARLRATIVARGLTKYNTATPSPEPFAPPPGRRVVLVIGQVADDEAIRLGAPASYLATPLAQGGANLALLAAARRRHPGAFIAYKPHPDVDMVGRRGAIADGVARLHADAVLRGQSVAALFPAIHQVEVISSLAGFEALLRGVPVTTHGQPFYAGWGLTDDLDPLPRRRRTLSLDELVAIALMVYPHYFDPESGLACPLDVALARLEQARTEPQGMARKLKAASGLAAARALHLWRGRFGG